MLRSFFVIFYLLFVFSFDGFSQVNQSFELNGRIIGMKFGKITTVDLWAAKDSSFIAKTNLTENLKFCFHDIGKGKYLLTMFLPDNQKRFLEVEIKQENIDLGDIFVNRLINGT